MKTYVGIDIGKNGGIVALLPNGHIIKSATPKIGNIIDSHSLRDIVQMILDNSSEVMFVAEDVHSIYGSSSKSNFEFGKSLGIVEGILCAMNIRHEKVSPKTWQKVAFLGVEKMKIPGERKKGQGVYDNKAMALVAAKRLYPNLDLRKSNRCEKAHDGIVDALLMAHYAKLKYN